MIRHRDSLALVGLNGLPALRPTGFGGLVLLR